MFEWIGNRMAGWANKWVPDVYVITVLLTILVALFGVIFAKQTPFQMVTYWGDGFFNLLTFGMQMVMILIMGHAVASSPLVSKFINALALLPKNSRQATFLVCLLGCILTAINWGIGMIAAAMLAREIGKQGHLRGIKIHYPILAAAAYLGQLTFPAGLTTSAPLVVATSGHFLEPEIGIIPIQNTLLSPLNIAVLIGLIVLVPIILTTFHPKKEFIEIPNDFLEQEKTYEKSVKIEQTQVRSSGPAQKLENSVFINWIIGLGGIIYLIYHFATRGFDLNLNITIFLFLIIAIWVHKTPIQFLRAISNAVKSTAGIILLFPFYAGMMGMMSSSGLVSIMANWFVAISNEFTYPLWTFISTAIINLFIPSGGGQWAVQGPIMVKAAPIIGVSIEKVIMAFAYGDALTNQVQPFWALAILSITGLKAKDIIAYTFSVMILIGIFIGVMVLFLPA